MAKALGRRRVFVHWYGGILSAYGLWMADAVHEEQVPAAETYTVTLSTMGEERLSQLSVSATAALTKQGYSKDYIVGERFVMMRYEGTDNAIMIQEGKEQSLDDAFRTCFGLASCLLHARIWFRVARARNPRAVVPGLTPVTPPNPSSLGVPPCRESTRAYFELGWDDVPVYKAEDLQLCNVIPGPSIIVQPISIVVPELNCQAFVTANGDLEIKGGNSIGQVDNIITGKIKKNSVQLSVVHMCSSIHGNCSANGSYLAAPRHFRQYEGTGGLSCAVLWSRRECSSNSSPPRSLRDGH
jgi:5-oxoprolinase (ATP-hydrolysing)